MTPSDDIPAMLRDMAARIESGEVKVPGRVYLVIPSKVPEIFGWGKTARDGVADLRAAAKRMRQLVFQETRA